MVIPYAQTFTATVSGSAPKFVTCEHCQFEYVYILQGSAQGQGTSMLFLDNDGARDRAGRNAEEALYRMLERDCAPVPWPKCSKYQTNMVEKLRRGRWTGLKIFAIVLLFLLIPVGLFAGYLTHAHSTVGTDDNLRDMIIGWAVAAAVFFGVVGIVVFRSRSNQAYDPNTDEQEKERRELASQTAFSLADYQRLVQEARGEENANPQ